MKRQVEVNWSKWNRRVLWENVKCFFGFHLFDEKHWACLLVADAAILPCECCGKLVTLRRKP